MINDPALFMSMLGISVIVVEDGTEIEHDGEKLTVTESNVVARGRNMYMTPATAKSLTEHPSVTHRKPLDESS